jgi:hypothetical protein
MGTGKMTQADLRLEIGALAAIEEDIKIAVEKLDIMRDHFESVQKSLSLIIELKMKEKTNDCD